jgi:histidinol-phosphate aminotransferase
MTLSANSVVCRSFSRRSFFRFAVGASALASMPILTESRLARAERPKFADPNIGIHIDANENPLGPSQTARQAIIDIIPKGGRYEFKIQEELIETFAQIEGIDPQSVLAFPGSSEPLHYTILAFTNKDKPVVLADPGYEAPIWAAAVSGAPVIKVPLADPKGAATHDVKAMMAASPAPGVIYICNPNNPTGTLTSRADIEYAVDHLPKGSVLLIDEAYIHFSDASSALDLVKAGKDVIVLRTFSKLYGMAGLRMGFVVAKPELLAKLTALGGMSALPITAVAAASASLRDQTLVPTRKKIIGDTRTETIAWLTSNGYACTPSESNCFMVDVRRPGKEVMAAMAAKEIFIGRVWPAWPTHVRITVGTADEMLAFRKAFLEVMGSSTAGLVPPLLPRKLAAHPFTHLS